MYTHQFIGLLRLPGVRRRLRHGGDAGIVVIIM